MDSNSFWTLIEQSSHETATKEERTRWLVDKLARGSVNDVLDFEEWLRKFQRKVDTWDMWGGLRAIFGGGSSDGFWYFQLWLIGLGRKAFAKVSENPDSLPGIPEVRLLALKRHAYITRTTIPGITSEGGRPWTNDEWPEFEFLEGVGLDAYTAISGQSEDEYQRLMMARDCWGYAMPNPQGEQWDLDDESEIAERLPNIAGFILALDVDLHAILKDWRENRQNSPHEP